MRACGALEGMRRRMPQARGALADLQGRCGVLGLPLGKWGLGWGGWCWGLGGCRGGCERRVWAYGDVARDEWRGVSEHGQP